MSKTIRKEKANNTTEGLTLRIVNTRELKTKLHTVDRMEREIALLGICKKWVRNKDTDELEALEGHTKAPPLENAHRGQGGVGLIANPLIPYHILVRQTGPTIQSLTVKTHHTCMTVIYISPRAI